MDLSNRRAGLFLAAMVFGSLNVYAASIKGYKGDDLPAEQLAVVHPHKEKTGMMAYQTIQFFQVDDVSVGGVLKGWPKKIEVPAGEHKIIFRFFNSNAGSETTGGGAPGVVLGGGVIGGAKEDPGQKEKKTITFNAAAGHEYIFKFEPLFTPTRFWIEDKDDGSVAGEIKSEEINLNSIFKKK
jgi:hypothetical protein